MDVTNPEKSRASAILLREDYGGVFERYLPPELRQSGRNPRVISVGCGFGLELLGLRQSLPDAYIEAIDESEQIVRAASRIWNEDLPEDRIRVADAKQKESFGREDWDLIVVRNPHVTPHMGVINKGWAQIFRNCFDRLKQKGFLYLTTLSKVEIQGILEFLSEFPLMDVTPHDPYKTHQINPPIENKFPFTEQYVVVLQKIA